MVEALAEQLRSAQARLNARGCKPGQEQAAHVKLTYTIAEGAPDAPPLPGTKNHAGSEDNPAQAVRPGVELLQRRN